jgi:hypothetical protein
MSVPLSRLLLVSVLHLLMGCNYYRTRPDEAPGSEQSSVLNQSRLLVLHQADNRWLLTNPVLEGDMLKGTLSELLPGVARYADPTPSKRYKHVDRNVVLNLVHLYINEYSKGAGDAIAIPISSIKRIDVVEPDEGRTIASHVLGGAGLALGALSLLVIIVLLTKSSCPFVYAHQGNGYQFVGEAYGGAIFAPLERDDYMPLPPMEPVNGQYLIKINNELKERQYTNVAQLWAVDHPDSLRVLLDSAGNAQTISHQLQTPLKAFSVSGESFLAQVVAKDSASYLFHEDLPGTQLDHLELTFPKGAGVTQGKLVLRAQNSLWLDYLFGEFTSQFGTMYNRWATKQRDESRAKLSQWQWDQGIPLTVHLQTEAGWQLVEAVPSVGPLAARDLVIPIDLTGLASRKSIKLKLSSGFMFWELDYAAMDFSPNVAVEVKKYPLQRALTEKGKEVVRQLQQADDEYLEQDKPGTSVTLAFGAPARKDAHSIRSFFLRTRGYYEHVREYNGMPDMAELYSFRKPGRFIEFSKEKYREVMKNLNPVVTAKR